jgi:hypothetical protein
MALSRPYIFLFEQMLVDVNGGDRPMGSAKGGLHLTFERLFEETLHRSPCPVYAGAYDGASV